MIYVASDIHGQYERYLNLIKILQDEDKLYVLGDVIDRGPDGLKILQDLMKRKNVELLMGNHELMMLQSLNVFFDGKNLERSTDFAIWTQVRNGGMETYNKLKVEHLDEIKRIYDYLQSLYLIRRITVNKVQFHLSHSFTIEEIKGDLKYEGTSKEDVVEIVWKSIFKNDYLTQRTFKNPNEIYVFGHVPVQRFTDSNTITTVILDNNVSAIDIDCGMAMNNEFSRIGCLRLDDLAAFYF